MLIIQGSIQSDLLTGRLLTSLYTHGLPTPSSLKRNSEAHDTMASTTAGTMENGKAPVPANGNNEFRNNQISSTIRVQPPRREDLQPAYAQTLQGESEDAATHGWYGSMSTFTSIFATCFSGDDA